MSANDLLSLQQRIMKLLDIQQELRNENRQLRAELSLSHAEQERLMQKNDVANRKVHEMIQRLQVLERNSGQ